MAAPFGTLVANAQEICDAGVEQVGSEVLSPVDQEINGVYLACHKPATGEAFAAGVITRSWDEDENAFTVRGAITVEAKAVDG